MVFNFDTDEIKYLWQKITRGHSDKEIWGLSYSIAEFIVPRLKVFKNRNKHSTPMGVSAEEWDNITDKMCFPFEILLDDNELKPDNYFRDDKAKAEYDNKVKEGLDLFVKYYYDLWD